FPNNLPGRADAVAMTATLVERGGMAGDELGLICRSTEYPFHGYAFGIGPSDGFVGVHELRTTSFKTDFVERKNESAIRSDGVVNRLRADCVGAQGGKPARLTLYVNGRRSATATHQGGMKQFDGVAFYVYSRRGGTTALFDNLVVRELKGTD